MRSPDRSVHSSVWCYPGKLEHKVWVFNQELVPDRLGIILAHASRVGRSLGRLMQGLLSFLGTYWLLISVDVYMFTTSWGIRSMSD